MAAYSSREGGVFAFSDDLSDKRQQLAEIERSFSHDIDGSGAGQVRAA